MEGITLMDRQEAGYSVALRYGPDSNLDPRVFVAVTLACGTGPIEVLEAVVPAAEAMEAFLHPALYVDGLCGCARCSFEACPGDEA